MKNVTLQYIISIEIHHRSLKTKWVFAKLWLFLQRFCWNVSKYLAYWVNITRTTILRILKKVKYYPLPYDVNASFYTRMYSWQVQFCQWTQQMIRADPNFFYHVMFSDETVLKNNGELNRHNCHYWLNVNLHWHREINNLHRWNINI